MPATEQLQAMEERIRALREAADSLRRMAENFPALARNAARIQAAVAMLEINLSDLMRYCPEACSEAAPLQGKRSQGSSRQRTQSAQRGLEEARARDGQ